jgi:TonB family protein
MRFLVFLLPLALTACLSAPAALPGFDPRDAPFHPRSDYPTEPNVSRLIGPEDCRGAELRAASADLPIYPARAYSNGRQGWVVVRFHVYQDGSVHRARVARGVPGRPFNQAATRAVSRWRFQPLDGVESLQNCVVMFEFRLGEVRIR